MVTVNFLTINHGVNSRLSLPLSPKKQSIKSYPGHMVKSKFKKYIVQEIEKAKRPKKYERAYLYTKFGKLGFFCFFLGEHPLFMMLYCIQNMIFSSSSRLEMAVRPDVWN